MHLPSPLIAPRARHLWLATAIAVVAFANTAAACPGCTYERMLNSHWHYKMFALQMLAALLFTVNRLDVVRVLYIFIPLTVLQIKLHLWVMWEMFPGPGEVSWVVYAASWIAGLNLIGVVAMYGMSALKFFRRDKERRLPWWQPIAYVGAVLLGYQFYVR